MHGIGLRAFLVAILVVPAALLGALAAEAPAPAPAPLAPAAEPAPSPPPPSSGLPAWTGAVTYAPTNGGLKPERLVRGGRTHYYQLAEDPVGTLVIFHGCGRTARAFFPYDPVYCPECIGFPEHVAHTKQALRRGYAVLAMEPLDTKHLCWSSSNARGFKDDRPNVAAVVTEFLQDHGLQRKPVYLLGTSSGGTMALKLVGTLAEAAKKAKGDGDKKGFWLQVDGIISEEAAPPDFNADDGQGGLLHPFPPTIWIGMERGGAYESAAQNIRFLQKNDVPSARILSPIRAIGPTFFSDRAPAITQRQSEAIVEGLHKLGVLDEEGYLLGDPEMNKRNIKNTTSPAYLWTNRLKKIYPWMYVAHKTLTLSYRNSLIQQAMNVAFARHDAVADYLTVCLAWLESRGDTSLSYLLDRYTVPDGNLTLLTADRVYPPTDAPRDLLSSAVSSGGSSSESSSSSGEDRSDSSSSAPEAAEVATSGDGRRSLAAVLRISRKLLQLISRAKRR